MKDINLRKIFLKNISSRGRLPTREVAVGDVPLGGGHPVRLQSMASSPTTDTEACVEESLRIIRAGADYVRFTAQNVAEAENLANIRDALRRRGCRTPLIADVHFNPAIAETAARIVEKVRINPGNFVRVMVPEELPPAGREKAAEEQIRSRLVPLLQLLRDHGAALRIGVNHGSLASRIVEEYGDTPQGMVVSAMEYLRICRREGFHNVVLSMKSSNARVMVQAYRLLVAAMAAEGTLYPLHLGITEAGEGSEGRIKSATGIGALLADGIGDTIRVSLTEPSEQEIPVARKLVHHFTTLQDKTSASVFPDSFDPFAYHPPASPGIPGISRDPVVVAPADYPEDAEPRPDLFYTEGRDHLLTSDGREIPYYHLAASATELPPPAALAGKVVVAEAGEKEGVHTFRRLLALLEKKGLAPPVIFKKTYDMPDEEAFLIAAAADLGPLFLDGYGQGIWIRNKAEGRRGERRRSQTAMRGYGFCHPAGGACAHHTAGVYLLSLLRPHPLQHPGGDGEDTGTHVPSERGEDRHHGMHRQRSRRDGRRRLRLCGRRTRPYHAVPQQEGGQEEHPRRQGRGRTGEADQGERRVGGRDDEAINGLGLRV